MRRLAVVLAAAFALVATGWAVAASLRDDGRIGPATRTTGNGRKLAPAGRLVRLGHFPTGGALTPDGRFYWTVSTGRALNDVRIVDLTSMRVVQTLALPGASGGIAMAPRGGRVYVSGIADSDNADERRPGLPGRRGDVVHVFTASAATGRARETGTIAVPPPPTATEPQNFPPTQGKRLSWPDRLAISPDGRRLLVPLNLADAAAIVDTRTTAVRYVPTGDYPYGAAVLRGGKIGLVSNEAPGTVSVIDLASATKVKDIQVGSHLSHPEAIALDPKRARAYVAIANTDQVAVIDTTELKLERTLSVERPPAQGASPVALTTTPSGTRLVVATSGADELAVIRLPGGSGKPWTTVGRIPTAAYPADVQVTAARRGHPSQLAWIAGKGFGAGANPGGPDPLGTNDSNLLRHPGSAVLSDGLAGVLRWPGDRAVRRLTAVADRQLVPSNQRAAPRGTPLRAGGPIKHVFYVVRENRTYDQVLGDDARGDGDAALTLFGRRITPNMHALVRRFPLTDHVYANSEASIDGHFLTSAAKASDYVHKNWQPNYAGRGRPYDFGIYSISWPGNGFLFDQADRQGVSYFNYGEAIAGTVPLFPDKDRGAKELADVTRRFDKSDIGPPVGCYPNDAFIGKNAITGNDTYDSSIPAGARPGSESRFACFKQTFAKQLRAGTVPSLNYLVLPSDHTEGTTPGRRSPRSMVAENDYGLAQIVDLVSHSPVWKSSAIFVLEDDSQDGADHVDAHRMPAAVISPFARRGAVVHTRYDMGSMIRSMELILGLKPLGLLDGLATPMYDAFSPSAENAAPYTAIAPSFPLERLNAKDAANARLSRSYHLSSHIDQIPQRVLDRVLWQSVHGAGSQPPPPGPNAEREGAGAPGQTGDGEGLDAGRIGRAALAVARDVERRR